MIVPPPLPQLLCRHLSSAAGWCIFSGLCPQEARALEDCIGGSSSSGPATRVPKRCEHHSDLLNACIEAQIELADLKHAATCESTKQQKAATAAAAAAATEQQSQQ